MEPYEVVLYIPYKGECENKLFQSCITGKWILAYGRMAVSASWDQTDLDLSSSSATNYLSDLGKDNTFSKF